MPFYRVEGITEPQAQVLLLIIRHVEEHGFQPSLTELAETLGITVKSVRDRMLQLAQKGYVEFPGKKMERCFRLKNVTFKAVIDDRPPVPVAPTAVPAAIGDPTADVVRKALAEYLRMVDNEPQTVAELAAGVGAPETHVYEVVNRHAGEVFEKVAWNKRGSKWRLAVRAGKK